MGQKSNHDADVRKGEGYMKKIFLVLFCLTLVGCVTTTKMNKISLGMTKEEVIKAIGDPNSTKATDGQEVLEYQLFNGQPYGFETHWVILRNGKVVQYGKAGDFGSAIPPTQDVNLDIHQH